MAKNRDKKVYSDKEVALWLLNLFEILPDYDINIEYLLYLESYEGAKSTIEDPANQINNVLAKLRNLVRREL